MQKSLQGVLFQYLWLITFSLLSLMIYSSSSQLVKAVISYFRQIATEHADHVKSLTISYLCTISRMIHVPTPTRFLHLVNGWTCESCLIHQLDALNNSFSKFVCQPCLGYESEVTLKQVCKLKSHSSARGGLGHQCLVTWMPCICK